nr:uncharacterized protein LOC109151319 [Ipomoea batatas]
MGGHDSAQNTNPSPTPSAGLDRGYYVEEHLEVAAQRDSGVLSTTLHVLLLLLPSSGLDFANRFLRLARPIGKGASATLCRQHAALLTHSQPSSEGRPTPRETKAAGALLAMGIRRRRNPPLSRDGERCLALTEEETGMRAPLPSPRDGKERTAGRKTESLRVLHVAADRHARSSAVKALLSARNSSGEMVTPEKGGAAGRRSPLLLVPAGGSIVRERLLVYYIDEELQKIYERVEFHDNSKELEVKSQKYASDRRKENQFGAINITAIEENQFGARYEEQYEMDYVIPEDELRSLSSDSETESAKPSVVYREGDVKKPMFQ